MAIQRPRGIETVAANPSLSVVMPVHNALPWLGESVASILGQSFADFEFVILDDASTDGSRAQLHALESRDARIRLVESSDRLGPVASSNRVVEEARAPLVARMDADDVALPDRLRRQIDLIDGHSDAVLVGSLTETIDGNGRRLRGADFPRLVRRSRFAPFSHPTILFRRDAFNAAGGYRSEAALWEDVDLYLRMARQGRILVLADPLVRVRQSGRNTRLIGGSAALEDAMELMHRSVEGGAAAEPRLRPETFIASGSVALWSGLSPRVFGAMLRRAALGWNLRSAQALAWGAWADLSPRSLRFVLARRLALRSGAVLRRLGAARAFEWRPGEPPRPLRGA